MPIDLDLRFLSQEAMTDVRQEVQGKRKVKVRPMLKGLIPALPTHGSRVLQGREE
jgi:hypothetical protein